MRLPPLTPGLRAAPPPSAVPVPVRLRAVEAADQPELWVLKGAAVERLHAFVGHASGALVGDLDFAVSADGDVAVRGRRTRTGPPALALPAVALVPLLKLPNVYLPAGTRLRPPVRRDALRDWLFRPDRVTWLHPAGGGRFTVESVPADAFRPLTEWVEYPVPPAVRLAVQVPDTAFLAMEPFASADEAPKARSKPRGGRAKDEGAAPAGPAKPPAVVKGTAPPKPMEEPLAEGPPEIDLVPASEVLVRLREAERRFLSVDGPLDAPARLALWPRLADLSAAAGEDEDAALCWGNALWPRDVPGLARRWWHTGRPRLAQVDAALGAAEPRLADLRALVAWVADAATREPCPADVAARLPAVARTMQEHDHRLPVRLAWLGWVAVTRLSGGDVLALTRARDRLLCDLAEHGLRRDRDLPGFLRTGTARDPADVRVDAARVLKLREAAWDWCATDGADLVQRVYLDLTFAYALARSGDGPAAQALLDDVGRPDAPGGRRGKHRPHPSSLEPHQRWLWDAYRDRVRRLLDGEPPTAPLSADLRRRLGELDPPAGGEQRQRAERFLKVSRVLDPFSRVDPFRHTRPQDPLGEALADLAAYTAPRRKRDDGAEQIELGFRALFKEHPQPRDTLRILATAVPLSVRVGETFALDCVARVGPALERVGRWRDARDLIDRAELLEAAVGVAAHFGRQALIEGLLGGLHALLKDARGEVAGWVAAALGGGSFRFLSRLGLVDAARTLLDRMTDALTAGKSVGKYLGAPGLNRGVVYPALLRLAGGWFYFGQEEPARRALEAARAELFDGSMSPDPRADLAAAYAAALGHAPARAALDGFAELFARLRVTSYNAVLHRVKIVEAIALATGAEDFAADPRAKRWLDEDEYLVRRRIHADVARALAGAALR